MSTALVLSPPVNGTVITVAAELETQKLALLTDSRAITAVDEGFTQEIAVGYVSQVKAMLSMVESSRVEIKSPVLDLGRKIDDAAKKFRHDLEAEADRLTKLITGFQLAERERVEKAERERQQEIARLEKIRLDAEQAERSRQAELAKAEAARLAAQEAAFVADTAAETKASEDALKAAEIQKQQAEANAAADRQKQHEAIVLKAHAESQKSAPVLAAGMTVKDVWTFEVTDLRELASYAWLFVRVEPNVQQIKAAIANGMRECLGLRIFKDINTRVK